jgi:HPt (histidine-containing phosphotransfer) domain-containing protein
MCSSFDRSVLDALRVAVRDEGGVLTERLIATFGVQGNRLVDDLERAASNDDTEALFLAAHTLRGSGGTVGGLRLVEICARIEHCSEGSQALKPLVASVRSELRTLTDALAWYGQAPPSAS